MNDQDSLFTICDRLISQWCERRALGPLSRLLPAYVGFNGLTDGSVALFEALRMVRGADRDVLPAVEYDELGEAIAIAYQALKRAGVTVEL